MKSLREAARSADGTQVPLTILTRSDAKMMKNAPAVLEAYASYGSTTTPYHSSRWLVWVERGGVYAICHARGGGEKGRAWHEAGRERNKPNGHADLIACAERLIALGYTSPATLAVLGTSAGGLISSPAALKRPDLFRVGIARVAMINPSRLAAAENGANQFAEMGDPATPEGFRALQAQDAYVMLKDAKRSPDWFITVGLNDRRVEPWMPAKFAARAMEKFGAQQSIVIRAEDAGHGIGSAREQVVAEWADIFSFLLNRFGDAAFQAGGSR